VGKTERFGSAPHASEGGRSSNWLVPFLEIGHQTSHSPGRPGGHRRLIVAPTRADPARPQAWGVAVGTKRSGLRAARGQRAGVDIAPAMLERAADKRSKRAGSSEKGQGGRRHLQSAFTEGRFDRVVAEAVTMFVDRSAGLAREWCSVCRDG